MRAPIDAAVGQASAGQLEAGTPGRPCILLLHGFPELAYSWRKVMPALADAGFYVLAPDQRGYGATTGWDDRYDGDVASFRLLNLVRDMVCLLDRMGIAKVELVAGHDFGASVAACCALIRPDLFRRLALMSAPFAGPPRIGGALPEDAIHTAPPAAGLQRTAARKRIIREVEDVIQRTTRGEKAETLHAEFIDRLDAPDLDDEIALRPTADIIADICRDLGIAAELGTHPWRRRTPADIEALCARAAAASVTRTADVLPYPARPRHAGAPPAGPGARATSPPHLASLGRPGTEQPLGP